MTLLTRRVRFANEEVIKDEVTLSQALEITALCDANFEAYVSMCTASTVCITTLAFGSVAEYSGKLCDLHKLAKSLKHRRPPERVAGPTARQVAATRLDPKLAASMAC